MLEYEREQAPHEKAIIRQCLKSGKPLPDKIRNAPELEDGNEFFYVAFAQLETCRTFEHGPIPYNVILDYGMRLKLGEEQLERLIEVIFDIDTWVLGKIHEDIKAEITRLKNG